MTYDRPVRNVVLPDAKADVWEWRLSGACRSQDPALFFTPSGERGTSRSVRETKAKAVCEQCPVMAQCLDYALTAGEPHGVWGGQTARERYLGSIRTRSA